jgi:hypothetical protein
VVLGWFEALQATHSIARWNISMCLDIFNTISTSVADPGCLSRIPDPDFYPSRIPDLGSRIQKQQQKRGEKKFVVIPFYVAINFTKLNITLVLKC